MLIIAEYVLRRELVNPLTYITFIHRTNAYEYRLKLKIQKKEINHTKISFSLILRVFR